MVEFNLSKFGSAMLLIGYACISAIGLYLIKVAPKIVSPSFLAGFILYGLGFLIWIWILLRLPLSVAFPIAAGSLVVATLLTGHLLLGETVNLLHGLGALLILGGIVMIFTFAE